LCIVAGATRKVGPPASDTGEPLPVLFDDARDLGSMNVHNPHIGHQARISNQKIP
jgi:hypothetical protein